MKRHTCVLLLIGVASFSSALASVPAPDDSAKIKVAAQPGAQSRVELFDVDEAGESGFSFVRHPKRTVPPAVAGDEPTTEPESLTIESDTHGPVLKVQNGSVHVLTDLVLPEIGSLAGHIGGQVNTTDSVRQELDAINGVVNEHDADVAEHGRHFDSFMQVLQFMTYHYPHSGIERTGKYTFTGRKTFNAFHNNDIPGASGGRSITLATLRNIVGHWGSISIEATVTNAYYQGGLRKYAGHWSYCGTGATTCVSLDEKYTAGSPHGSLALVDRGVTHHGDVDQNDRYEKAIVLSQADYSYVEVELKITTSYGHTFASSTDIQTSYNAVEGSSVNTIWLQWGPAFDTQADGSTNINDYLAYGPSVMLADL